MAFTLANLKECEGELPALQEAGFATNLMAIQDGTANASLASGKILVGDGDGIGQPVDLSGDATLANTGALTITHKLAKTLTPAAASAAISISTSGTMSFVIANAAETNTMAIPSFAGQIMAFSVTSLAGTGSREVTVAQAINATGNTKFKLDAATQSIVLIAMNIGGASTLRWRVLMNDGATLS